MNEFCNVETKQYEIFLKHLGANVRKIRKEKNLSMEMLAHKAEIEYRQLGRIERGEGNTSVISLFKLSQTLNIPISQFFLEIESTNP